MLLKFIVYGLTFSTVSAPTGTLDTRPPLHRFRRPRGGRRPTTLIRCPRGQAIPAIYPLTLFYILCAWQVDKSNLLRIFRGITVTSDRLTFEAVAVYVPLGARARQRRVGVARRLVSRRWCEQAS